MELRQAMHDSGPWTVPVARLLPAVVGALLVLGQPALAQERACSIAEVTGEATLVHDGKPSAAMLGAALSPKDQLRTGPAGRVGVTCSDQTQVTVGPDTDIGLGSLVGEQGEQTSIGISLHRGIARFLAPVRTWGSFNVFGPVAVASVRSTEWVMETPKRGTNVFVRAGMVDVLGKRGDTVRLSPTEGVDVAPDGTMAAPKKWRAKRVADLLARLGLQ
ncbi:MAG: FecR domain-containing protein [Dongiaceae bacterium]